MKITIAYANGESPMSFMTQAEAEDYLESRYPDLAFGPWESANYDGTRFRMLVWENEDDAENDDGQHAVAEIIKS